MIEVDLERAVQRLGRWRGRSAWWRPFARRAAVAVIIRQTEAGLEALMIQRAERQGDRWSGHMAFPGGLVDRGDRTPRAAALRETDEEIGLDLDRHGCWVTRLSDIVSRPNHGQRGRLIISPFVFTLAATPPLQLNHEVADVVWVPLTPLVDRASRPTMPWPGRAQPIPVPYCAIGERRVWGMSLRMLDELVQALVVEDASLLAGDR